MKIDWHAGIILLFALSSLLVHDECWEDQCKRNAVKEEK